MLYNLKKKFSKAYTAIASSIVVIFLFILQFVVFESNLSFWKDASFWLSLAVMIVILVVGNEIYWRNGSTRAESNEKYINSAIEYSVRINRIKNNSPCLTEDFYRYIDELNISLYIEGRNKYLEEQSILKEDYYYGNIIEVTDDNGTKYKQYATPHCELTQKQLTALTKDGIEGPQPYYTKRQIRAILRAVHGKFRYEKLNATEILSGIKIKNNKYAVSYNANKNKRRFALTNLGTSVILSVICALFGGDLVKNGWSVSALVTFIYRLFMFVWRAAVSDEAGYKDVADTKRGVNVNRSNLTTMYATSRGFTQLFQNIDDEIQNTKKAYLEQTTQGGHISGDN